MRAAVGPERDRLALQHHLARRQRAGPLHHLRHAPGDVLEVAREHADLVAGLVELDARPVELVLERGRPETFERGPHVLRRARQHGRDGRQQAQREARQSRSTFLQRHARDFADAAGIHRGLPNVRRRQAGGTGDRIRKDAFERALPQLADEQLDQEPPLVRARAPEQVPQRAAAPFRRPGPTLPRDDVARSVHVEEGQRLALRGGLRHRRLEGPPPETDPALGQGPRQVRRGELGLASPRLAQEVGQQPDLLQLARGRPDARDAFHQRRQQHPRRITRGVNLGLTDRSGGIDGQQEEDHEDTKQRPGPRSDRPGVPRRLRSAPSRRDSPFKASPPASPWTTSRRACPGTAT